MIRGLLDQLDRAGVATDLLWCPNEFGVPVFIGGVRDIEVPERARSKAMAATSILRSR